MMHEIRRVISKRKGKYKLSACLEFDEGFFERDDRKDVLKEKLVNKMASALTDGYKGYVKLKEKITNYNMMVEPNKIKFEKVFPWVNRTINNTKKVFLKVHYNCINQQYFQNYLDEFCYKFSRRYFGDKHSDILMITDTETTWY